jgi:thiol-disulfide isomerase/thioredoxin
MLQEKIQNYWKNKSTWNKVSDLVFIVFIIAMLIPEGRMAIGGFVNRIKARVMNPAVQENGISLSDQDYYWPMTDLEGNAVNLNDYKGKVVFLNLWATWCPPCVGEMPEIQKLYDTFKSNPDIAFLLVSNEDNEKIRALSINVIIPFLFILHEALLRNLFPQEAFRPLCYFEKRGNKDPGNGCL